MNFTRRDVLKSLEAQGGKPVLVSYLDGAGIPTAGFGHTRNVHLGMVCTEAQAEQWLDDDLRGPEQEIANSVTIKLTQGQYDALIIFLFNTEALFKYNEHLLKLINAGKMTEAGQLMSQYNKITVNGKKVVSNGLVSRRAQEQVIWNEVALEPGAPIATGEVPISPAQSTTQTPTGRAATGITIASIVGSLSQALSDGKSSAQPYLDQLKDLIGLANNYPEFGHYAVHGILALVIGIGVYTLWHEHQRVTGQI